MKGYRTLAVNIAAVVAVLAAHVGFDVPVEAWEPFVLAVINFALRFVTDTPVSYN